MNKLDLSEPALAILVVDGKKRYVNERLWRASDETVEAYADRVRAPDDHPIAMETDVELRARVIWETFDHPRQEVSAHPEF